MTNIGSIRKDSWKISSSEENEFTWEIPNFRELIATNPEMKGVAYHFEAGNNIGLPTSWQVLLHKETNNHLGIYIKLRKVPEGIQKVKATFGFKMLKHQQEDTLREHEINQSGWCWGLDIPSFPLANFTEDNLEKGNLVIHINLFLYNNVLVNAEYKLRKFEQKSRDAAVENFQTVLDSGENADVTFKMEDERTLRAHAAILKAGSRVFSAMLQNPMQENATGVICIEDVTYEVMKRVLTFIYTGKVEDKWEEVVEGLVYASNKYELLLLFTFCDENLAATCTPENAWSLMDFAKLHGLKTAQSEIGDYFKEHIAEIVKARISS